MALLEFYFGSIFFIYHMHDNRSVCISAALYVKGGLCIFLTYLAFSRHFSIYTSKSSCKIRVFKKTFIFCLCFKEVGYQGIIFSLSQVHFIFSPCLPRIFERAHDGVLGNHLLWNYCSFLHLMIRRVCRNFPESLCT